MAQPAEGRANRTRRVAAVTPNRGSEGGHYPAAAQNPKAGDCKRLDNPSARWVCPKVATLNGEAARTKRRVDLQAVVDAKADQLATAGAVRVADPGSNSLSTYLAALGWTVPAGLLSDWLVLVPVLALELGAALAFVSGPGRFGGHLLQAAARRCKRRRAEHAATAPTDGSSTWRRTHSARGQQNRQQRSPSSVQAKRQSAPKTQAPWTASAASKEAVKLRLVDSLKAEGGKLDDASVRGVAKLIGAKKVTVHNAVAG